MKDPNTEAARWLRQAESDLRYAELGLRSGFYAQVCFQCQQICEKAIKALHYARGERIVFGHSLIELSSSLDVVAQFAESFALLDQYYIPTRYPNGLPGAIPSDAYTEAQATAAVSVSRRLIEVVRPHTES